MAVALPGGGFGAEFRAGAAVLLWWLVVAGVVAGVWPRARVPAPALAVGGALLVLALLSALSMGWASDDGTAFAEAVRVAGYLGLFALVVVASPEASARHWLAGLAIGLVAVAGLGVGSRMQPSLFPDQDLRTFLPSVGTRLSYPLNYWNGLGACMALAIVLLAGLGGHARTRAGRAAAVAALPVPALALFLTSSRGGVAALVAGLAVLLAVGPARARMLAGMLMGGAGAAALILLADARTTFVDGAIDAPGAGSQGHEMLVATLVVAALVGIARHALDGPLERVRIPRPIARATVVAVVAAVAAGLVAVDLGDRLDDLRKPPGSPGPTRGFVTRHLASAEGNGRYQFWETGMDAFAAEPLRGIGAGGYEAWWAREGSLPYFIRNAHSLFVEVAAELGLLGLAALLAFAATAVYAGIRARSRLPGPAGVALALLACGAASAAIDWTWQVPAAFAPVVVAAAILAGPALRLDAPASPRRWALGAAGVAVGCVAVLAAGIVCDSEVKLSDSRAAVRRGDLAAAAADAREASAVAPWSAAPDLQLALVRERRGDLPGARRAVRSALDSDPDDWRAWLVETRLATRMNDLREARRALRRVRMLNPRSPLLSPTAP